MLKGLGDIGNLMKMQKEMKNIQKRLKKMEITGENPGGDIKVTLNGEYECTGIVIDPEFLKSHESRKVEKTIVAAFNDAVNRVKEQSANQMADLTGGLDLQGLMK